MLHESEKIVLLSILLLTIIGVFVVLLFLIFIKRKNALILSKNNAEKLFKKELAQSQIEIREQTLENISWELHDNIGQLLTLAKLQLQNHDNLNLEELKSIISLSLNEVRSLSKMINPETIKNIKFIEALKLEIDRFNRLNFIESQLTINGEIKPINQQVEIIIFRTLQEFFSNTIKHSKATLLNVELYYSDDKIIITAKDNGKGFNFSDINYDGIGLKNIKNRMDLINADLEFNSVIGKGTNLQIIYYF